MSFLQKFQAAAEKVGRQATAFGSEATRQIGEGTKDVTAGFSLEKECERAAKTLSQFLADPNHPESALNAIPKAVLQRAKGLAVFRVVKAGFVWSGSAGSGLVIARLPDGSWSAPALIATGGMGFGLQIGANISDFVVVLNSDDAVKSFTTAGNLQIGGSIAASAGPIGTGAAINSAVLSPSPLFTYSQSKGAFAGLSLDGTALISRQDANAAFYGMQIPTADLLSGKIPAPEAASALYSVVEAAESVDESGLPSQSYVPSAAPPDKPIFDSDAH